MSPRPSTDPDDPRSACLHHLGYLRAFAYSLSQNWADADDLVQDTLVKAWVHADSFRPGTNLRAWLFTILRNTFFSNLRRRRRQALYEGHVLPHDLAVAPEHDARLAFSEFLAAFFQLTALHREILILHGACGYSCDETARMVGVAPGTVKSRASRARKRLAERLGLEGEDAAGLTDALTLSVLTRAAAE